MTSTSAISTYLGYILYPFILISNFLVYLFQVLVAFLQILAIPLLRFGSYLLHVALFPFRVLEKFQNICTFFGSAVVIGLVTGLILYFTSSFIFQLLEISLETSTQLRPLTRRRQKEKVKDITGFRTWSTQHHWKPSSSNYLATEPDHDPRSSEKGESSTMKRESDGYYTTWKDENKGESREGGLLSTMILEEDDNSSEPAGS